MIDRADLPNEVAKGHAVFLRGQEEPEPADLDHRNASDAGQDRHHMQMEPVVALAPQV